MKKYLVLLSLSALLLSGCAPQTKLINMDSSTLVSVKKSVNAGDADVAKAYAALIKEADSYLSAKPLAVTMKEITPLSGDKHDYMSMGPYWWPNPNTPDGLPYVRRDGQHNPEIKKLVDATYRSKTESRVRTLSYAYFFSGEEKYAAKAAELLRVWFINPETRMNPNLQYGQSIPGICAGRGVGLIDTHHFSTMLNAVLMLDGSKSWTADDKKALQAWFKEFYTWMLESKIGKDEWKAKNNHGTYYDVQICAYSMFCGDYEVARNHLLTTTKARMDEQFAPDGAQPLELARTNSWGYSQMNMAGWLELSRIADNLGIDMWSWKSKDNVGLKELVEWFFPFFDGKKPWGKKDISKTRSAAHMDLALRCYLNKMGRCSEYDALMAKVMQFAPDKYDPESSVTRLLFPLK